MYVPRIHDNRLRGSRTGFFGDQLMCVKGSRGPAFPSKRDHTIVIEVPLFNGPGYLLFYLREVYHYDTPSNRATHREITRSEDSPYADQLARSLGPQPSHPGMQTLLCRLTTPFLVTQVSFAVFIYSHGKPSSCRYYCSLRSCKM